MQCDDQIGNCIGGTVPESKVPTTGLFPFVQVIKFSVNRS